MYYINGTTGIDVRTIRRLDAEVPDADTNDRTDGRVGWTYYGISAHGEAWIWTTYNGDPECYDEDTLMSISPESDLGAHLLDVADEIAAWDDDHADWIRQTLGAQVVDD